MSLSSWLILLVACGQNTATPEANAPAPPATPEAAPAPAEVPAPAAAPADNVQTATLTTEHKETEFAVESTIRVTIGDQTHDAATASGMCHVEDGTGSVLQTASCFYAGLGTTFELRRTDEGISLWSQFMDEGQEEPSPWEKVWSP